MLFWHVGKTPIQAIQSFGIMSKKKLRRKTRFEMLEDRRLLAVLSIADITVTEDIGRAAKSGVEVVMQSVSWGAGWS